ncbi:hypothetical protein BGX34_010810 [Mortierella sp. NVP85]|nr:hypothetical protein BGX34_010810 [Mortierella sp. NVP85]
MTGGDLPRSLPSMTDPSGQRDLMQQIASNPLLAPGGIIDPHAMSQAFLQHPELMVQANAITQAMALAQQQQQQQMQMQQNQLRDQHPSGIHHHDSYVLHGSPSPHQHPYHQGSPPGQYSIEQQQQHYYNRGAGDVPPLIDPSRPIAKPRSPTNLNGGEVLDPYSSSPLGYFEAGHFQPPSQEHDDEHAPSSKLVSGRKGFSPIDSSPPGRSSYRLSRDGMDSQRNSIRRKTSGPAPYDKNCRRGDVHTDNEEAIFTGPNAEHRNGSMKNGLAENDSRHKHSASDSGLVVRTRSPTSMMQPRTKKAPHELLTEAEKKANHIASEQKRRQNIRIGFDSLVEIVPTLSECHRSEALILQKSVDYIQRLLSQKNELKNRVRVLQANLGEPLEDEDSASDMDV